jgi:hypothetical protein
MLVRKHVLYVLHSFKLRNFKCGNKKKVQMGVVQQTLPNKYNATTNKPTHKLHK